MKVGETKTVKLPFILKAQDFLCDKNGLRLERSNGGIYLYVNDGNRRNRFCAMPLGSAKDLKGFSYTVKAQSKTRMLFSVGSVRFVIDYVAHKVASNLIGFMVTGSKEWGDNVQMPWRAEYQTLFGLPMPPMEMDRNTAKLFWQWYVASEPSIVQLVSKNRKSAKQVCHQIELWLYPVFPYVKNGKMDFDLTCDEHERTFIFNCGDNEQLKADAEVFGDMMPDILKKDWKFVIEE